MYTQVIYIWQVKVIVILFRGRKNITKPSDVDDKKKLLIFVIIIITKNYEL